jgi:hypothetical protein
MTTLYFNFNYRNRYTFVMRYKQYVRPYARNDIRKYSFASRTVERWNSLLDGARAAESQKVFKALLNTTKI